MNMEKEIKILNIDDILPNRFQPRIQFSDKYINELADSIKEHGVIQPIVVRKISDKYEIIAGERRYKASILAGKTTIPAIVTDLDDRKSAEIALIENVQRQDLTPIEEAVSYKKILDMGYITQTELAEKLGKTQSTIANKLRLLNLDDEVQEALLDGKISERHARSLLRLKNNDQVNMLSRIINERLTVRKTDEEVEKILNNSSSDSQKVIEREELQMNDEIKNEFNIPTSPVYNEQPSTIEPIEVPEINPGFMDINKIENNAEDIFKPNIEQQKDLSSILNAPVEEQVQEISDISQPVDEIQAISEEEIKSVEEQREKNKFFNFFNFRNVEENPNYVGNIEEKETNMDFGLPEKEEIVIDSFNPFTSDLNSITKSEEINNDENIIKEEQNSLNSINVEENQFNPFANELNNSQVTSEYIKIPEENSINVDYTQNIQNDGTIIENPFNLDTELDNLMNIPNISNENNEQVNIENQYNDQEDLFSSINASYHLNDDAEFTTKIPVIDIQNEMSKEKIQEETPVEQIEDNNSEKFVSANFRMVINTIRECATTIEKYGYKIETDELDFEDSYEVTFKIQK